MTDSTESTATRLGKYRTELVKQGFTEGEIETLVIEAARNMVNKEGLKI